MSDLVVEKNIQLAPLTTFRLGGPAKFFTKVSSTDQLLEALDIASKNNWPVFILAGGSNLIVSDEGFDGLVIQLGLHSIELDGPRITAGASVSMKEIVNASIESGLKGLEWAGGLPGSFGGAIYGNAGCYGGEMKDSITLVKGVTKDGREILRNNNDCEFGYRDSIYKHLSEVIISATVELQTGSKTELREIADDHIAHRLSRHPLEYPNAGSIFKNVPINEVPVEHLPLFEDSIKNDPFPIVPAAKIIAVAGLQGRRVGSIQLSEKHSNFMVNLGGGKTSDLLELIEQVKSEINKLYRIKLEVEPQLVGF